VTVLARFNARANDTLTATLQEDAEGVYSAMLPITTPGEWELRVDAQRADAQRTLPSDVGQDTARFTASTRVTVVRASAP